MTERRQRLDPVEEELRTYYEAEARARKRPEHGARRRAICERFAERLQDERRPSVVDVGAGPASDAATLSAMGIEYVGADLAVGNALIAAELGRTVVPSSLFGLPFRSAAFSAGWSMSTLQHVPDDRIDAAMAEIVRVLEPGAPVTIGLWGGRDEVVVSPSSNTGIALPRHFTLRTHDRIRSILRRHLVVDHDEILDDGAPGWEYHVSTARTRA